MDTQSEPQQQDFERLRAENAELKNRLQEYQTIFDSMPIMFWYKDTENRHLRVNRAAAELEGSTPDAIEGKLASDIYPKEQAEAYHKDDLEVINSGKPKLNIIEKHVSTITNEEMWMQAGKVPYRDKQGNIVGIIVFAVDITEQKRAENALRETHQELEKRNRQMGRVHEFFLSTLEHLILSTSHGINQSELTSYLKDTRLQFEKMEQAGR